MKASSDKTELLERRNREIAALRQIIWELVHHKCLDWKRELELQRSAAKGLSKIPTVYVLAAKDYNAIQGEDERRVNNV